MRNSTFPTGKEVPPCMAMPNRDPAATIWYSGAFSAKYLSEVSARGFSCISSKMMSVVLGSMGQPASIRSPAKRCWVSKLEEKSAAIPLFASKLIYATFLYACLPNSRRIQVLPTWRAPCRIKGFLFAFFCHSCRAKRLFRSILGIVVCINHKSQTTFVVDTHICGTTYWHCVGIFQKCQVLTKIVAMNISM